MTSPAIRRVTLHRVRVPLRQVYVSAMYRMSQVYRTIIEVESDDGCTGIGEAPGSEEVFEMAARLARSFLGQPALDRVRLQRAFATSVFDNRNGRNGWSAYGGLELALWDWAGRWFGLPASSLLGTPRREWVDMACPVPAVILDDVDSSRPLASLLDDARGIDAIVEYCRGQQRRYGFRCFKYKSAGISAEWDAAVLQALRDALGPEAALRWDPNAAYSVADAAVLCGRLEAIGLEFYEDPTDDISGMAALRTRLRTPLATNMCVVQLDHLASAIRHRPADVLLVDVYMWGGIENYLTMAATARAYGFEIAVHSFFETGVGTAVNLHLAAGLGDIRRASDCGLHVLDHDVIPPDTLVIEDGRMRVPPGPGWGVSLDRAAMAACTVARTEIEQGHAA
jgi:glucarate dehydratase